MSRTEIKDVPMKDLSSSERFRAFLTGALRRGLADPKITLELLEELEEMIAERKSELVGETVEGGEKDDDAVDNVLEQLEVI